MTPSKIFLAARQLVTLEDAAEYIQKLPEAEQLLPDWQNAVEAVLLVVELNGPTMMARIGMLRALNRNVERVFDPSRKDKALGKVEIEERPMTRRREPGALASPRPALWRYLSEGSAEVNTAFRFGAQGLSAGLGHYFDILPPRSVFTSLSISRHVCNST
jgi:hypothetical protein